jgi:hypothetical protein
MCEAEGMGLCPWGALGRGAFKSEEEFNAADREGRKMGPQTEEQRRITLKLDELAKKKGTQITSIALAYIMHKAPYVFPIVGIRKVEHLQGNIDALSVELTDEEVDEIEAAQPFDLGFPGSFLMEMGGAKYSTRFTVKDMGMNRFVLSNLDRRFCRCRHRILTCRRVGSYLEAPPKQRPIPPMQGEKDFLKETRKA